MAGNVKGITIEIGANTSKLNKDLNKVNKPVRTLKSELKGVEKALKLNPGNVKMLQQKFQLLNQSVEQTKAKLKTMKEALAKASANGATEKNSASFRKLQREIAITEGELKKLNAQQKAFGSVGVQQIAALGNKYKALGAKITAVGSAMMTTVSAWGFIGVYAGKKLIDLSETQAQQEEKLTEIYKTRLGEGAKAVKSTEELTSALQKQGVVGDEVQLAFAQQMATFSGSSKTVNTLLPAFNNLLVQQKGLNGTTEDAVNLGNMFGKVMTGQTGALKRVGITFDESQEKILKYGTEEERAAVLAEVITQNVGEMNKKFAETDAGKIQQAKNVLGDMGEAMGAILLPAVADAVSMFQDKFMPVIEKIIGVFQNNPALASFAMKLAVLAAVAAPIVLIVGKIVTLVGGLMSLISTIVPMLSPPVVIIAGIVALLIAVYKNSETLRTAVSNAINAIKGAFSQLWAQLQPALSSMSGTFLPIVKKVLSAIGTILAKVLNIAVKGVVNSINRITFIIGVIRKMVGVIRTVGGVIKGAISNPFNRVKAIVTSVVNTIKSKFNTIKSMKWIKAPKVKWGSKEILGKTYKYPTGISWNAKAMNQPYILNGAQIFGSIGDKLLGGGEAGSEMILGTNTLNNMISSAVMGAINQMGNSVASSVASGIRVGMSGNTAMNGEMAVNVYLFKNGDQLGRYVVNAYDTYKPRLG